MGATVTETGSSIEEVLQKIKEQIKAAFTMQPDSDIVVHNKKMDEFHLYKVVLSVDGPELGIELIEIPLDSPINLATQCAIQVHSHYGKKTRDAWSGCVHFE